MQHIEKLTDELKKRGINVALEQVEVVKNSVQCTGLRVIDPERPGISPVIYYSQNETMAALADRITDLVKNGKAPDIRMNNFWDSEYVASHLILGVSRRDGEPEDILVRHYLNFDIIMRLIAAEDTDDGTASVKVNAGLLGLCGMGEDEAWKHAITNSEKTAYVRNMSEILGFADDSIIPLYVAGCSHNIDGASVLYFRDVFGEFCRSHSFETLVILPSSTQEVIVMPDKADFAPEDLMAMVDEINESEVSPVLRMDPAVYCYTLSTDKLDVIASL